MSLLVGGSFPSDPFRFKFASGYGLSPMPGTEANGRSCTCEGATGPVLRCTASADARDLGRTLHDALSCPRASPACAMSRRKASAAANMGRPYSLLTLQIDEPEMRIRNGRP